jgi:hypothetical protein
MGLSEIYEISKLKTRINELEEILCPIQQHDYIEVDSDAIDKSTKKMMCKKCKKVKYIKQ